MTRAATTRPVATAVALPALGALALGALLVVAAAAGTAPLVGALLLVQAAVVADWHRALAAPGSRGGVVVGAATALAADLVVVAASDERPLRALPAVVAGSLVAAVVHQVVRRDGRTALTTSLTATGSLGVLVALAAMHLATAAEPDGTVLVATAAAPAAVVAAAEALRPVTRAPAWSGLPVAVVAAAATAVAAVAVADGMAWSVALGCATAGAVAGWVGTLVVARSVRPGPTLLAGLPQLLAAPAVYVASRLLVG